ncbi:DUF1566 domain-containing protein [Leucothrix arctica]|nr:DUF1566 domain-containing protein [Leucothrix arctica]
MKTIIIIALTFGFLSGVAHAQSCSSTIDKSTPDVRFITSNDEVKDLVTNLTWKRCAQGQTWNSDDASCTDASLTFTWSQALSEAYDGWRVPNIKELHSIVEVSCRSPAINEMIFPNTDSDNFWTASPYINNAHTWSVSFTDGNDQGFSKSEGMFVRLVKDAS